MRKILRVILPYLATGLLCVLVGGYAGMRFTWRVQEQAALFSVGWASQMAFWLCEDGTPSEARRALHDYIRVMEKVLATKSEPFMARITRADMVMALTRVALIEEAEGQNEEAKRSWERAADMARITEYKSVTPESMKAFVMRDTNFVSLLTKARQAREKPSR